MFVGRIINLADILEDFEIDEAIINKKGFFEQFERIGIQFVVAEIDGSESRISFDAIRDMYDRAVAEIVATKIQRSNRKVLAQDLKEVENGFVVDQIVAEINDS